MAPKSLQMLLQVTTTMKLKRFAPWEKSYGQPRQYMKKQRHYFDNKGQSSQSYGFSSSHIWMWELDYKESWVPKNWYFWTMVSEKNFLRVCWPAWRSNQSILKEISAEYSLEALMLKLKPQYFGHLMWRTDSLEKILMLGKIEGGRKGQQKMRWMASQTRWTWVWVSSRSCWWTRKPGMQQSMGLQRFGHDWETELNWNSLPEL